MAEEKLVPELRFPEFSGEWEEKRLGEVVSFKKGKGIPKSSLTKHGTKCILYGQLYTTYNEIIGSVSSFTDINESKLLFGNVGDVLIPSSGETALDMSLASALFVEDVALGGDINILRPKKSIIDSKFLSYQINSTRKIDLAKIAEGASVVHLYNSNLNGVKIFKPKDIKEQEKIGNFFYTLDKKLELQQERIDNLKEYKKGMMQRIFSQEIGFKDENGRDYPEWEEKKLGEVADIKTGNTNVQDAVENGKYAFFDRSVIIKRIDKFDYDEEAIIYPGEGSEFYPRYYNGKYALHQRAYSITTSSINMKYLLYMLMLKNNHFSRMAVGSTVKSLRMDNFEKCNIYIPIIEEQEKIANFLSSLDKKIELEEEKLHNFKELKKGLMQRMFI